MTLASVHPARGLRSDMPRALKRDTRGAVVLMAVPMAFLLIGFLYYAIGVGDAIIRRETLQDAADASAFSAAVMMARGMNLVVLINVIMASLLAILVMLRIVQIALLTGIGICVLLSYPTFGASLSEIPPLTAAVASNQKAYESTRRVVKPMIEGLHDRTADRTIEPGTASERRSDVLPHA